MRERGTKKLGPRMARHLPGMGASLLLAVPVVELAVDDGDEERVLPLGAVAVVVLHGLPPEMAAIWKQRAGF